MDIRVKITGVKQVQRELGIRTPVMRQAMGRALYEEANAIFNRSQELVPVDLGNLKSSGLVHEPEFAGNTVQVQITYGNTAVDYAILVHEDLTMRHDPPTSAKYLEIPMAEAVSGFNKRVGARLQKAF